jgi:hypothetical protein
LIQDNCIRKDVNGAVIKNVIHEWMKFTSEEQKDNGMVLCGRYGS